MNWTVVCMTWNGRECSVNVVAPNQTKAEERAAYKIEEIYNETVWYLIKAKKQ